MNHLSLFNGIGGFMLAAHWAGWNNIAYVEKINYLNDKIKLIFPEAKCHEDIKNFTGKEYRGSIDVISGGDPCQPSSIAGLGKGTEDDRYLWPEMFRVIQTIHPTWIINENVDGTIANGILDLKIDDLESEGYTCQSYCIPAEAVGALHKRQRVWLIAHDANCIRTNRTPRKLHETKNKKRVQQWNKIQLPQEPVNLWYSNSNINVKRWETNNNAKEPGIYKERLSRYFGFGADPHGNIPRHIIESGIIRMLDGLPEGMDYTERNKRIQALGNAIVPQLGFELMRTINIIQNETKN